MSNYVKWTTTFLLCIACVFPHKVKSDEDNVATLRTFVKKEISENVVNPNLINKDPLGITQGATKFTGSSKSSHIDDDMQRINFQNSFSNEVGSANDYIAIFDKTNSQQLLRKRKKMIKNILTGIYTSDENPDYPTKGRRNDNLSGIKNSSVFHANADIGDHCKNDFECPTLSKCTESKCVCIRYYNYKENMCFLARIGDTCTTESECPPASICQHSKCSCPSRFINMGMRCIPRKIGGDCNETVECPILGVCRNGQCACKDGYVNVNNECRPDVDECKNDSDCWKTLNNATCFRKETGNYCSCQPSEIATSTQCLPRVKLGDSCEDQLQCPMNSNCENGTCVCEKGYVNKTNYCLAKRKDECHNDSDCDLNYLKNSYCDTDITGNICLCPLGYMMGETECLPSEVKIGDSCKITIQCSSESVCINDTCVCRKEYIMEGLNCVKRNFGSCEEFISCPKNSECVNGFCICRDGYVKRDQECVFETYNVCYNDNDCLENWKNTTCIKKDDGNHCQCQTGYVIGINECLPKRNNGEPCQQISQCPSTSLCKNGICVCRDIFTTKDNKCVKRIVGDPCDSSYQCPTDSECDEGFCTCRDYYTNERGGCVKSKLGNPCNQTKDCPQWDLCHKGTCICNHGYEEINNICVPKIVGGHCQSSQYCPEKSICRASTCVCKSIYVERDLKCVSPSSGTPDYVWAIIAAAVGISIISIAAAILVVRGTRSRAKWVALHQSVPTVSSVVESRYPNIPLRSYESMQAPQKVNEKDQSLKT